jgi:hypothetical protein
VGAFPFLARFGEPSIVKAQQTALSVFFRRLRKAVGKHADEPPRFCARRALASILDDDDPYPTMAVTVALHQHRVLQGASGGSIKVGDRCDRPGAVGAESRIEHDDDRFGAKASSAAPPARCTEQAPCNKIRKCSSY